MAARLIPLISLSFALCSQGYQLPTRSELRKRDLDDFAGNILFTSPQSSGIFLEIDVGDNMVPVELDTLSSDLLVTGSLQDPSDFQNTGVQATVSAPVVTSQISAPILTGNITIAGQSIQQAFVSDPNDDLGLDKIFPWNPAQGLLGMGPSGQSMVVKDTKTGFSPLDSIYLKNPAHPYSTILFAGIDESDPTITDPLFSGLFSVGEPLPLSQIFSDVDGMNASAFPPVDQIGSQPAIPLNPSDYTFNLDAITVTSDPGGSVINQTALLNSRSNVSFVPANIVSTVLGSVQGVSVDSSSGMTTIPCDTEVTMEMQIGGVMIPIDPATVVVKLLGTTNTCVSGFQEIGTAGAPSNVGVVLGQNFMQNVYLLLGYGSVSGQTLSDPIMKLLPLTDAQDAHDDFVAVRGQAGASSSSYTYSSSSSTYYGSSSASSSSAPASADHVVGSLDVQNASTNNNDLNLPTGSLSDKLKHCLPAIIVGAVVVAVLLIGFAIYAFVSRRRRSGARESAYRNLHHAEAADNSRALYGHEDDGFRYNDPYTDKL